MKIGFFILMIAAACSPVARDHSSENLKHAEELFAAFNNHDWKKMSDLYIDSASFLDPSFGIEDVKKSRAETALKYAAMEKIFPDIHDEVVAMYPSGDQVTIEFISTGTSADGVSFKLPIVSILTFRDGLIVRDATYYDNP